MAKLNWTPWMGLDEIEEEMRRVMRDAAAGARRERCLWTPAADVVETDFAFSAYIELPGLERNQIAVEVRGDALWVYGERRFVKDASGGLYQMLERSYGPFARKFILPKSARDSEITAVFSNGLLIVTAPKEPPERLRRRIPIS